MKQTELCKLAEKYGANKCPAITHTYTPYYYKTFYPLKESAKKVLEIGIGDARHRLSVSREDYVGPSLRMWRDFFPNAMIYGIDIDPDTMFSDERIQTFCGNETDTERMTEIIKEIGSDIDIVIDDGNHNPASQTWLAKTLLPLLKKDVIYIIEDVKYMDYVIDRLEGYECTIPELTPIEGKHRNWNHLVLVKNK